MLFVSETGAHPWKAFLECPINYINYNREVSVHLIHRAVLGRDAHLHAEI